MGSNIAKTSFVIARLEGPGVSQAVDDQMLVIDELARFTKKGSPTKSGKTAQTDLFSKEFETLEGAICFTRNLASQYEIHGVQFVVHFPFEPQGNWGFSRAEILGVAELGADLAVTAMP